MKINIFWFRRDLRLNDNTGLNSALKSGLPVLPIFIFDSNILDELENNDPRVQFIHQSLKGIQQELVKAGKSLRIFHGNPQEVWKQILSEYEVNSVFANKDYEPYATERDRQVQLFLSESYIEFQVFKDQVIFEKSEIVKADGLPYTVYTPYKNKWLSSIKPDSFKTENPSFDNLVNEIHDWPELADIGFTSSPIQVLPPSMSSLSDYGATRDYPAQDSTSKLGPHLRFGTVSVREMARIAQKTNQVFLSELIWREFFMQILFHFPHVVSQSFRSKYDDIKWRNNEEEFEKWCQGQTGYPIVDAGMRELNATGYMHNRVRMITASFLVKHLLIDWRWGEAYFAQKLLDYDLASNNGNWQWVAGTGCDAAPYFRIFNPWEQTKKFDGQLEYINKWVPEVNELDYPVPIVDHKMARERTLAAYKNL
ncbi:MAG: deoxyribodipyrimidine photo-lyase [Reichenbachiella sp.]|uniref:cryptochrome/photolyase family protein n=1 Tax=Reichenbachiella sp. TaxID=2184521 RepID=UPI00329984BF